MAESIIYNVIDSISKDLERLYLLPEIKLGLYGKFQLRNLNIALSKVNKLVLDIEQKKTEPKVRELLSKIKDAVYDADDFIDNVKTEVMRRQMQKEGSSMREVCNFFPTSNRFTFRVEVYIKLEEIRRKIKTVYAAMINSNFTGTEIGETQKAQYPSLVEKLDIIGRDDDQKQITDILIRSKDNKDVTVVVIVGSEGVGKTTVAKLVYNDKDAIKNFELRMWASASDNFDIDELIKRIMKSASGADYEDLELDNLRDHLQNSLTARKFLLVLDDVRNEHSAIWEQLKDLLNRGANGSAIVVTTRSENVAEFMGSSRQYKLEGLRDEECWSLFTQLAVRARGGQEEEHSELLGIGRDIVTKCGGVPLAVKTLGSLLYLRNKEQDWLFVKDSKVWESFQQNNAIKPLLQLSYDLMPFYLKQCLLFSTLYPKYHVFYKESLIHMWMAEGYIRSYEDGQRTEEMGEDDQQLEEIGDHLFEELLLASFFEAVDEGLESKVNKCKMNDILYDLVQSTAKTEFSVMDIQSPDTSEVVRHISPSRPGLSEEDLQKFFVSSKKVRTIVFPLLPENTNKKTLNKLILICKRLRFLDLSNANIKQLPYSIGRLKQLRYLKLSGNHAIRNLPNSICKLVMLQTLDLDGCSQLQKLPGNFARLASLRHLEITVKSTNLPKKGDTAMTSLQLLSFTNCTRLTSLFNEMQQLTSLKKLRVRSCPRLASIKVVRDLKRLKNLEIVDCSELSLLEGEGKEEGLKGLTSLQSILLAGLPKLLALPRGLQEASATLEYMSISTCYSLIALPEWLENFTGLRTLRVQDCPNLLSLPKAMLQLKALQELHILNCVHLSSRCKVDTGADWPKIAHVPDIYLDQIKIKTMSKGKEPIFQ